MTGFLVEGLRIEEGLRVAAQATSGAALTASQQLVAKNASVALWSPVGLAVAKLLRPLSSANILSLHQAVWWLHAISAFVFIAALPFTKAFHIVGSPLNIFFADPSSRDRLVPVAAAGVGTLRDFTRRQLLQIDACTWCGKCLDACPNTESGTAHPTCSVIQRLQSELNWATSWAQVLFRRHAAAERLLVSEDRTACASAEAGVRGGAISAQDLWSCCMRRACEMRCPVLIEHPRIIVDLRRRLVDQRRIDQGLQDALMKVSRYGNSFGQSVRNAPSGQRGWIFR